MKKFTLLFCLFVYSLTSFAQVNLDDGLVAYYPFNGNANDMSGNKNNPSHNNATLTTDRHGNPNSAYHFNGKNNYMKIPNSKSLNTADELSIVLWVKPTGFYMGKCFNNMLIMKGDNDYRQGNYFLRFADPYSGCDNTDVKKEIFYGTGDAVASTPFINLNQWYSVVWVCDNVTVSLYIDCELKASVPANYISFSNRYDLYIGHLNNSQYPYWLNGDLDDVRIYNRAITKEEIMLLCEKVQTPPKKDSSANLSYSILNCNKEPFNISQSQNIKSYKWNLGYNGTAKDESFSHFYKPTGVETEENSFRFIIDDKQNLKYKWVLGND